ncbi:MAG: DUF1365 family protein [Pseudoalteromonas tetraodonis]
MAAGLNSSLYECEVVHKRLSPKTHSFRYRLFFLDLDLDELPRLGRKLWLFGHNRFNLFQFRDSDHLDLGKPTLRENLDAYLGEQGIELPVGAKVRLVTLPRIAGYIFNPVCFYFFSSADGRPLHALVEVCNTFKELKPYLIEAPQGDTRFRLTVAKNFYVSPFSELDTEFDFRLKVPGERIEINIDDREDGEVVLLSWIRGQRRELTNFRLFVCVFKYPLLTLQVVVKIHWQALRLWLKKLPFHRKADRPELQTDLLRPHSSLTENKK